MADEADKSDARIESVIDAGVERAMRRVQEMPIGIAGDCDTCGTWSGRLVDGMCAPCRDRYIRLEYINGKTKVR